MRSLLPLLLAACAFAAPTAPKKKPEPIKPLPPAQKADNAKIRAERDALMAKYEDLDPEAARKAIERLALLDDSKLVDSGKLEEVVTARTEKMRLDFEKKLQAAIEREKALSGERDQIANRYTTALMDNEITNAAARLGVKPGAINLIRAEARQKFKVHEDKVVMFDGDDPVRGKDGNTPVGVEEWLGGMQADLPDIFVQDRGGGAYNSGTRSPMGSVRTIRRSDPQYKEKAQSLFNEIADGKVTVVD
jgi:hypothetical protein